MKWTLLVTVYPQGTPFFFWFSSPLLTSFPTFLPSVWIMVCTLWRRIEWPICWSPSFIYNTFCCASSSSIRLHTRPKSHAIQSGLSCVGLKSSVSRYILGSLGPWITFVWFVSGEAAELCLHSTQNLSCPLCFKIHLSLEVHLIKPFMEEILMKLSEHISCGRVGVWGSRAGVPVSSVKWISSQSTWFLTVTGGLEQKNNRRKNKNCVFFYLHFLFLFCYSFFFFFFFEIEHPDWKKNCRGGDRRTTKRTHQCWIAKFARCDVIVISDIWTRLAFKCKST